MKRLWFFLFLLLIGCGNSERERSVEAGRLIAVINDLPITDEEIGDIQKDPILKLRFQSDQSRKRLLEQAINYNVLYIEAMKRGYYKDLEVVFGLRDIIARKVRADILRKSHVNETVSNQEIRDFFENSPKKLDAPEKKDFNIDNDPVLKKQIRKAIIKSRENAIIERFVKDIPKINSDLK